MDAITGAITGLGSDFGVDLTSALQGKYTEFMDVFAEMAKSMNTDSAMTFPQFPNSPVKPEDTSFSIYANYSMNEYQEQLQDLMDAEKFKGTADKQMIQAMG